MATIQWISMLICSLLLIFQLVSGQDESNHQNISGVIPSMTMTVNHYPPTEAGIGALMPGKNRLWSVMYVTLLSSTCSSPDSYKINNVLQLEKHPSCVVKTDNLISNHIKTTIKK